MDYQQIADDLLWPVWRGMDAGYKARYARSIWQQFEDNIRSAAYTSKLTVWYDTLCRKLTVQPRADDVPRIQAVLSAGDDRAVLRALRDETTYLALLVRLKNDERKAEYQNRQEELF